jgi:uncharacterized cupin superfamily protein
VAALPKISALVPKRKGLGYPDYAGRVQRLRNAGGLTDFCVNLMRRPPGNWSNQRNWYPASESYLS